MTFKQLIFIIIIDVGENLVSMCFDILLLHNIAISYCRLHQALENSETNCVANRRPSFL